jgi:hypothetical protein
MARKDTTAQRRFIQPPTRLDRQVVEACDDLYVETATRPGNHENWSAPMKTKRR